MIIPFNKCTKSLLATAKHDLDVRIKEKVLLRDEIGQGYLAEVKLFGQAYFDGGDGLIKPAIVESQRLFGVDGRFIFQVPPTYGKAGSAGDLVVRQGVCGQLLEGLPRRLSRDPILDVQVIGLEQAEGKTALVKSCHRDAIFVALAADEVLLTDGDLELIEVVDLEGHHGRDIDPVRRGRNMVFLRVVLLVQLKGIDERTRGCPVFSFLEVDPVAVGSQADTEYIMLIENKIAFLFHLQHIVHSLAFGVSLVL